MAGKHESYRPSPRSVDPEEAHIRSERERVKADYLARADDAERRGLRYVPQLYRQLAYGGQPSYNHVHILRGK